MARCTSAEWDCTKPKQPGIHFGSEALRRDFSCCGPVEELHITTCGK